MRLDLGMRYFLAIFLPPIAVLLCGKPVQCILSIVLTLCFWLPGAIHAILVVNKLYADRRHRELIEATRARA